MQMQLIIAPEMLATFVIFGGGNEKIYVSQLSADLGPILRDWILLGFAELQIESRHRTWATDSAFLNLKLGLMECSRVFVLATLWFCKKSRSL